MLLKNLANKVLNLIKQKCLYCLSGLKSIRNFNLTLEDCLWTISSKLNVAWLTVRKYPNWIYYFLVVYYKNEKFLKVVTSLYK